ncbi:hypothetical protein DKY63_25695 [Pseudomonas putida]|uniref:Phage protein n=1 Tax=Pseudomonas putida TaxID=303 RepID=A0A2Z4RTG0_PSEPU|nr:hypothetical protein [Pseudomonas putida]AWY43124.1 hypothetical protein DKY63_25695 [Pseudomonas putida]
MALVIEKPSQLFAAIVAALRSSPLSINVGSREDFIDAGDQPWVLVAIERNAANDRASDGRIAHVLTISLQTVTRPAYPSLAACDLTSALKNLVTDNRWGLSGDQCDLPANLDAIPSSLINGTQAFPAWTLSFTQTLYFGTPLLDDPLGTPKFARTWEVSDIDDPDQYTELED